jgi:hypothetical protein
MRTILDFIELINVIVNEIRFLKNYIFENVICEFNL